MDKKNTLIIGLAIVIASTLLVFIALQGASFGNDDTATYEFEPNGWEDRPADSVTENESQSPIVVTAKHAYRQGAHIIAGEIPLPSPCHIMESRSRVSEDKKQLFIELISSIKSGENCPQDLTPARFRVDGKADKSAEITASLNGKMVVLNLIEAGPDENLEDFELYIKG
jgi:hypothetical protein